MTLAEIEEGPGVFSTRTSSSSTFFVDGDGETLPRSRPRLVDHLHLPGGRDSGDERRIMPGREPRQVRKGLHQNRGHLRPVQIAARQHKRPDATSKQGREFRLPVPDPCVFGDDRPAMPANLGQPLLVARVLREVGVVGVDLGSLLPQVACDGEPAERTVDEERRWRGARPLRAEARSGALPGCQGQSARSPLRVPPLTPQP